MHWASAFVQPADVGGLALLALGMFAALFLSRAYQRNSTVTAALQTIEILEAKVKLLEENALVSAKNREAMAQTITVLQEQVTNAAPVRTLIDYVMQLSDDRHADAKSVIMTLARIEEKLNGALTR